MRFLNGDTVVARITPCLENGKTAFVDVLSDAQVTWGSTEYIVLRSKPPLPPEFAYCLARSETFRDFAIQGMTGSSGRQRVPPDSLAHLKLVDAGTAIVEAFNRLVKPLFARAGSAARECRSLAVLRDALLPRLNVQFLHVAGSDKPAGFYSLDAIISVGYRVNSKRGNQFRIWATRTLRDHLLRGYTLNERRLTERGMGEIEEAVRLLGRTLTAHAMVTDEGRAVLQVVAAVHAGVAPAARV